MNATSCCLPLEGFVSDEPRVGGQIFNMLFRSSAFEPYFPIPPAPAFKTAFSKTDVMLDMRIVSEPVRNAKVDALLGEIEEYRSYLAGWDGVCTEPPDGHCLDAAKRFVCLLPRDVPLPETAISGGEDVALFWENDARYFIVYFRRNDTLAQYFQKGEIQETASGLKFAGRHLPRQTRDILRRLREPA